MPAGADPKYPATIPTAGIVVVSLYVAAQLLSDRVDTGLRNQFGERTVTEVVSGEREELMMELTKGLSDIAIRELGVEVVDVRVKRIDLPQEVSESVYGRMRSERAETPEKPLA